MPIRSATKRLMSKAAWNAYNTYRKGTSYRSQLSRVAALFNASRADMLAFQRSQLEKLLRHAYRTTPYYRELFKVESPDISQIPTLEKINIRERLEDLCSEAVPRRHRIKNATGGSTGTPLTFYQDRNYWNQRNLSVYYFDRWAGWNFGERQLIIWVPFQTSEPLEIGGITSTILAESLLAQQFSTHRHNDAGDISEDEQMGPQTILAYPSSLYQFARFIFENGLKPWWDLKGIISSAEMLHPHYRDLAETVFSTKVYNRYGGREVGLIAMECAEGRMHINCRDLYLEIDSPDPYTQPGDILITQLNNYAMPFIRYRIGDIGLLSDELCRCGSPLPVLVELLGRSTATFRTRTGTLIHAGYFTQQFIMSLGWSNSNSSKRPSDTVS